MKTNIKLLSHPLCVKPVVVGAAVVDAPVVVDSTAVVVVVVFAAAVVAEAVVFWDVSPRSTVARPAISCKYKRGFKNILHLLEFDLTLQVTLVVTSV